MKMNDCCSEDIHQHLLTSVCARLAERERYSEVNDLKGGFIPCHFSMLFFFFLQLTFVFHNLLHFTHHTWNSLALATFKAVVIKSATTRTSGNYESSKDRRV